jgi:hypothetical protein
MSTEPSPQTSEFLWKSPDGSGPFRVRLWYRDVDGRPAIVGLEMWGVEPVLKVPWWDSGYLAPSRDAPERVRSGIFEQAPPAASLPDVQIKASDVRLPLGKLLDELAKKYRALGRAALTMGADPEAVDNYLQQIGERRPGRPPIITREQIGLVADLYKKALTAGLRYPDQWVEGQLQLIGVDISASAVRHRVAKARELKLLPPSRRRKP